MSSSTSKSQEKIPLNFKNVPTSRPSFEQIQAGSKPRQLLSTLLSPSYITIALVVILLAIQIHSLLTLQQHIDSSADSMCKITISSSGSSADSHGFGFPVHAVSSGQRRQ